MTDAPAPPPLDLSGPQDGPLLILAHGAGAGLASPFMETVSRLLAERGIRVGRFNFSYMAARIATGKRRPPPKAETLISEYASVLGALSGPVFVGGKSMGGRVASMLAASSAQGIAGLVCLGYPFHPPNKPDALRIAHLASLAVPALIVQGERDPFGARAEIESYGLPAAIAFHWIGDGDHDFGPRGGSGFTRKGNLAAAADAIASFIAQHA